MNSSDDVAFHINKTSFSDLCDHKGIKKGDLGHFSRNIASSMVFTMSERCEGSRTRVLDARAPPNQNPHRETYVERDIHSATTTTATTVWAPAPQPITTRTERHMQRETYTTQLQLILLLLLLSGRDGFWL